MRTICIAHLILILVSIAVVHNINCEVSYLIFQSPIIVLKIPETSFVHCFQKHPLKLQDNFTSFIYKLSCHCIC